MESGLLLAVNLDATAILVTSMIGAICGFLAGQIMKGRGFGVVGNIIVGIIGAALFSAIFGSIHLIDARWVNEIVSGTLGAMILLFLVGLLRKSVQ